MEIRAKICKSDEERRLVFGWASVAEKEGVTVVDSQGDTIPIGELEAAAYEFCRTGGQIKAEHDGGAIAELVECFALTPEKAEAMSMLTETFGLWIGFKITDEKIWQRVKSGELSMLSIGVRARRMNHE